MSVVCTAPCAVVHDGFQNVVSSENATVAGTWRVSRRMELYECSTGSGTAGRVAVARRVREPHRLDDVGVHDRGHRPADNLLEHLAEDHVVRVRVAEVGTGLELDGLRRCLTAMSSSPVHCRNGSASVPLMSSGV